MKGKKPFEERLDKHISRRKENYHLPVPSKILNIAILANNCSHHFPYPYQEADRELRSELDIALKAIEYHMSRPSLRPLTIVT